MSLWYPNVYYIRIKNFTIQLEHGHVAGGRTMCTLFINIKLINLTIRGFDSPLCAGIITESVGSERDTLAGALSNK